MATITKAELETAVATYVDASKIANATFTASKDDFTACINKIGDMVTLYLPLQDKLGELQGNNLPNGQIIEEYMVDEFLPSDGTPQGEGSYTKPAHPTFSEAAYSYSLADKTFGRSIPNSKFQAASIDAASYAGLISSSIATVDSSYNAWTYAVKRELLGKFAAAAITAGKTEVVGDPASWTETETEDFILKVLCKVEDASDMNDDNINGRSVAGAPSLKLYVSHKVMPTVKVKALAGAINKEELAIPAEVKTILDFGADGDNIVAILVDPRGVKVRDCINEFEAVNLDFQTNMKRHIKQTCYYSKYGFIHVFTKA